jgi:hypothetical protein
VVDIVVYFGILRGVFLAAVLFLALFGLLLPDHDDQKTQKLKGPAPLREDM